jgi:hypothetical protein
VRSIRKATLKNVAFPFGIEDIATDNPTRELFATINCQTPNLVLFFQLSAAKLQIF